MTKAPLPKDERTLAQKLAELPPMPPKPEYDGCGEGHYKGKFYDDWSAAIADHEGDIAAARGARLALAAEALDNEADHGEFYTGDELRSLAAACREVLS